MPTGPMIGSTARLFGSVGSRVLLRSLLALLSGMVLPIRGGSPSFPSISRMVEGSLARIPGPSDGEEVHDFSLSQRASDDSARVEKSSER